MKSILVACTVSALCYFSASTFADAGAEADMKAQLAAMTAAFNKSDAKAVAEFFTMDATLINPQGVKAIGRVKIGESIANDLGMILKSGKSDFKFVSMRMLGPDIAFVDSIHEVVLQPPPGVQVPAGVQIPPMRIQFSGVTKKTGGKWLWLDARPYAMMPVMGGNPPNMPGGRPPPPGMRNNSGRIPPPQGGGMPPGPPPGHHAPPPSAAGQVPKGN